ncbi:MAG: hypothetical protein ABSD21_05360 [Rhizomicrobium sp.]|jgi:hypothetical protein
MKNRIRDFKKEYANRVKRGLAKGHSLSRARGHISAADIRKSKPTIPDPNDPREKALQLMKAGATQKTAAKRTGVSVEKVRRYLKENTTAKLEGKKWVIMDRRPTLMLIASRGKIYFIPVTYRSRSRVGHYWNNVNKFLATNDASYLARYAGKGIRDAEGNYHPWETGPNTLRKLDSIGELDFTEIYHDVAL